jgi:hypothetical protein
MGERYYAGWGYEGGKVIYPKQKLLAKIWQETHDAEILALAKRIAQHPAPGMRRTVDKKLLATTAARLQKQKSVLATIKCSEVKN